MEIGINKLTDSAELIGQVFWICDFRQPDIDKKPIRSLKPTKAMVMNIEDAPKTIYYSKTYFSEICKCGNPKKSSAIGIYDTTGYRSYPGIPISVFDNYDECVAYYNEQCDYVLSLFEKKKSIVIQELEADIQKIKKQKI